MWLKAHLRIKEKKAWRKTEMIYHIIDLKKYVYRFLCSAPVVKGKFLCSSPVLLPLLRVFKSSHYEEVNPSF